MIRGVEKAFPASYKNQKDLTSAFMSLGDKQQTCAVLGEVFADMVAKRKRCS
jgi:hypothetical protein